MQKWYALAGLSLIALGCGSPNDDIRTYSVPKTTNGGGTEFAEVGDNEPHRMLAAIVPVEDQAWFFKLTGPEKEIDKLADTYNGLLKSIEVEGEEVTWTTPEGWQEKPASGMRQATLVLPKSEPPIEISVIRLGRTNDDLAAYVRDNVNRWRGQLSLEPLAGEKIEEFATTVENDSAKIYAVDYTGTKPAPTGGMNAPFAGGGQGPPSEIAPPPAGKLPGDVNATSKLFASKLPEGWSRAKTRDLTLAVYKTADPKVEVAVSTFRAVPAMVDKLGNINRWRSQVGLDPITNDEVPKSMSDITIDGIKAHRIAIVPEGENEAADQAIVVGMVERDQMVWFFKLSGDTDALKSQLEAFDNWLASIKFDPPPPSE